MAQCACYFPLADAEDVKAGQPSLEDVWYVLCACKEYQAYQRQEEEQLVQEARTEDQVAVMTELRAHEQGLLGAITAVT